MRWYAAEVDSSSIAKSPFIFSFGNGAISHALWKWRHWWRAETGQDWILCDLVIHTLRQQRQQRIREMSRLNGKTAVITGGATGIGLAAAKRFIDEGAFVFIFGRRQEALDAAVADLGPNARAVKGSVSDEGDLDRLYAAVKAERGTLDIVFANAGGEASLHSVRSPPSTLTKPSTLM
jgi:hypothetical protein